MSAGPGGVPRERIPLENARLLQELVHDAKNPLTAILGYSELLSSKIKDRPDALAFAAYIHSAAKTLNHLISDLADLAAVESGELKVEMRELDLSAVIADVASRPAATAQAKKIQVAVQIAPDLPILRGDAHRIGQVLQNLCANAMQYSPEGGRITLEASVSSGRVVAGVRFSQVEQAQSLRKEGLALKIAREIVQLHGGEMGAQSKPGEGSFFYFFLPVPKS